MHLRYCGHTMVILQWLSIMSHLQRLQPLTNLLAGWFIALTLVRILMVRVPVVIIDKDGAWRKRSDVELNGAGPWSLPSSPGNGFYLEIDNRFGTLSLVAPIRLGGWKDGKPDVDAEVIDRVWGHIPDDYYSRQWNETRPGCENEFGFTKALQAKGVGWPITMRGWQTNHAHKKGRTRLIEFVGDSSHPGFHSTPFMVSYGFEHNARSCFGFSSGDGGRFDDFENDVKQYGFPLVRYCLRHTSYHQPVGVRIDYRLKRMFQFVVDLHGEAEELLRHRRAPFDRYWVRDHYETEA